MGYVGDIGGLCIILLPLWLISAAETAENAKESSSQKCRECKKNIQSQNWRKCQKNAAKSVETTKKKYPKRKLERMPKKIYAAKTVEDAKDKRQIDVKSVFASTHARCFVSGVIHQFRGKNQFS